MNNRFKFRVWDKMRLQFIYPHNDNQQHFIIDLNGRFHNLQNGSGGDDYVIQQYTGLTDSNDDPIYEGDIIIDNQKQKYEIIFDENHARYDLKVCGENKLRGQTSYGTEIYEKKHIEVIGNIFENPELLKTI
jgi:uncharacterized phage protein (TIGR01671 family)